MRMQQKQINHLLLFSFLLFIAFPQPLFAMDGAGKGKLQIKTDRILQDNEAEIESFGETELDKVFPALFTEEVQDKVKSQQQANEQDAMQLKGMLFTKEIPEKTTLYDVKSNLFKDDYSASYALREDPAAEDEQQKGIAEVVFYGGIVTVISFVFGGVLLLLRNF